MKLCISIPGYVLLTMTVLLMSLGCNRQPEYEHVELTDDLLILPLALVNDGDVHFFTYKFSDRLINFFVRTDDMGQLHTHFDACYGCFKYKRGYIHEGDVIICVACRLSYKLKEAVWDYIGACAPITLKSRIVNEQLIIQGEHLQRGSRFF